ncbi:MAG TPA: hypothetical protein VK468_10010 [Pyrinomonadaceae bacterium]|nr:hypothetical protein [Pyrinomonadaceae bacterium]
MGQETGRKKDEDATGRDLPNSDGTVSDEDVDAITDRGRGKTGQDHSTERHEATEPDDGVGDVQDRSDTTSDVARIRD